MAVLEEAEEQDRQETKKANNNIKEILTLLGIPELSLDGEDPMGNWKSWKEKFRLYMSATGVQNESGEKKVECFLKMIGEQGRNIFRSFDLEENEKSDLDAVMSRFDTFFGAREPLILKRAKFFARRQEGGETAEAFACDLVEKSIDCELDHLRDSLVRSVLVTGLLPSFASLKDRLLNEKDGSLETTLRLCREAGRPRIESFLRATQEKDDEELTPMVFLPGKRRMIRRTSRDIPPNSKFGPYLREWIKSPKNLLIVGIATLMVLAVLFLIIFFSITKRDEEVLDMSPRIRRRADWNALKPKSSQPLKENPPQYVIVSHTAGSSCTTTSTCATTVNNIQAGHIAFGWDDIGYNFLVGGDGYAYEGRGWGKVGSHTLGLNLISIGLSFIGNFMSVVPPKRQIEAAFIVFSEGVRLGKLHPNYTIYFHKQLIPTLSPGNALINEIKTWPHWKSCDEECESLSKPSISKV